MALSISLKNFNIEQCGYDDNNNTNSIASENSFYNTDKCNRSSTNCVNVPARGFFLDTYECECKAGFYKENGNNFSCIKCSEGCETCQGIINSFCW